MKEGLLTKEEAKFFAGLATGEINVGGIWSPIIKWAAPTLLDTVDNKFGDKIPEPWQTYLENLTTMAYNAMQDGVITQAEEDEITGYCTVVINAEIDIPLLEENDEAFIFLTFWKFMASLIRKAVRKMKKE